MAGRTRIRGSPTSRTPSFSSFTRHLQQGVKGRSSGTRFKLVDAILALENRAKDEGFRARLLRYPVPAPVGHVQLGRQAKAPARQPRRRPARREKPRPLLKASPAKGEVQPSKPPAAETTPEKQERSAAKKKTPAKA